MLDPWAIRNSYWKKSLAALLYENRHLQGAACIHALCHREALAIRAYGLTNPIAVIPNAVELPDLLVEPSFPEWSKSLPNCARVLLFLGRLHPKKGLPSLLEAWKRVCFSADEEWFLVVAGWDQDGHRAELERMVDSLGITASVRFVGPQFGEQKKATLRRADGFVLPSHSEGLPMAVLEAWAYGLPVLMTPQCNLAEGFDAGAALSIDLDPSSISYGLTTFFNLGAESRVRMGNNGRSLVRDFFTWETVAMQVTDVYQWVLGKGDCPPTVI
jgi:poly(glycerol-phosphate) alpha-glucosyltransferase